MRSISEIKNLNGKVILLRAGFDVPIKNKKVIDFNRIKAILPTIKYLTNKGPLVILAHQGRPNGKKDINFTQKPLVPVLEKFLKKKIKFAEDCIGGETEKIVSTLKKGDILLLENLRFYKGEESNDKNFTKSLAKLGDIYVNDAFTNAHRDHASITGLPKYLPSYAGFQLEEEIKNLSKVFKSPKHPFLFILGGAKFETKLPIIKKYLKIADHLFIGGAILNDFLKAKGLEVGQSLISGKNYGIEKICKNNKIILPEYVIVKTEKDEYIEKNVKEVLKTDNILDVGEKEIENIKPYIKNAKLVVWNGPLGKYEAGGAKTTKEILKLVAQSKAESIIGGGDTVDLISEMKMMNRFSFVSTGGGAALDFLANGTLPGIKALQ